jgi:putative zinc finger/helix-turn-helix YgiT family protein
VAGGLPHVTIKGVEVSRCEECGETEVVIRAIESLHRVIAGALIRKRHRLAPLEIKFLRKYLGWSGSDFAQHMGTTPETVSRWENGRKPMGSAADRLLRLMVASRAPVSDYTVDVLAQIAADGKPGTDQKRKSRPVQLGLELDDTGWHFWLVVAARNACG